jgi:arylsulfatase B
MLRFAALLAASAAAGAATAPRREAPLRPHILIVLLDDWGHANLGAHRSDPAGKREVVTPQMDGLIATGRELTQAYVHKYCSPSRSSLQTGRLPIHVNVLNLDAAVHNPADPVSGFAAVPRNMTGIATKMKAGGYATHQVGKWVSARRGWQPGGGRTRRHWQVTHNRGAATRQRRAGAPSR